MIGFGSRYCVDVAHDGGRYCMFSNMKKGKQVLLTCWTEILHSIARFRSQW